MWRAGGWSRSEIALELGGVLKARDATGIQPGPASHKKFSRLIFVRDGNAAHPLGEGDTVENMGDIEENEPTGYRDSEKAEKEKTDGGWLENDDIEEF
jgi:cell cycle checkpoint protein